MPNTLANSKRIAKNTLLLYLRMLFMMLVSLYTSRVVLNALGVEDYGIYNVVGGVVAMFSILSGSLSAAISRFITYELGRGDKTRLSDIFSTSVNIQIGLSFAVLLLAETLGLWFLNEKMFIPENRIHAAHWVYQLSLLTFVINLISVPYNACIIAYEKMSAFAYISILDALGKLAIAFLILRSPIDKLVFYAILMCLVALIVRYAYGRYCKRHFEECQYRFKVSVALYKEMAGFAGWNFIGATSAVLRDQGGNIIINLFFGPSVNAARGLAVQVSHAVTGFVGNFMTALNPQITKSYATGDRDYMMTLVFQGARLSFYMLLLLSLPVLVNTHYILALWLKVVPQHSVLFVQLALIWAMCETISSPLITVMLATGKIRDYQIVVGGLQMLNLPISYVLLRIGCIPEMVTIVAISISQVCLAARLYMLRKMVGLSVRTYMKKVYLNIIVVALLSAVIPVYLSYAMEKSFGNFIVLCLVSLCCTSVSILYIGCNRYERKFVASKTRTLCSKLKKHK